MNTSIGIEPNFDESIYVNELAMPLGTLKPELHDLNILNACTTFYGSTNSGKTHILRYFCSIVAKHIYIAKVWCATGNNEKSSLSDLIPSMFISKSLTRESFIKDYENQKKRAEIYDMLHDLDFLNEILINFYESVKGTYDENIYIAIKTKIGTIESMFKAKIADLTSNYTIPESDKLKQIDTLQITKKNHIIDFIRKSINDNLKTFIDKLGDIRYKDLITNINMNPNMLFVFDDVTTEISSMKGTYKDSSGNKRASVFEDLLQRGRHYYITTFIALQTDNAIPPAMRHNIHYTIFTEEQSANSYINKATNGIGRRESKRIAFITNILFNVKKDEHLYFLINKHAGNPKWVYMYIKAPKVSNVRICDKHIWDYDLKIKKKTLSNKLDSIYSENDLIELKKKFN
jgi:hypothetical protein